VFPWQLLLLTSRSLRETRRGSVELRHAPAWQFALANHPAGEVLRALAWLGPEQAGEALRRLKNKLSSQELTEIASARAILPSWLAKEVSEVVVNG